MMYDCTDAWLILKIRFCYCLVLLLSQITSFIFTKMVILCTGCVYGRLCMQKNSVLNHVTLNVTSNGNQQIR